MQIDRIDRDARAQIECRVRRQAILRKAHAAIERRHPLIDVPHRCACRRTQARLGGSAIVEADGAAELGHIRQSLTGGSTQLEARIDEARALIRKRACRGEIGDGARGQRQFTTVDPCPPCVVDDGNTPRRRGNLDIAPIDTIGRRIDRKPPVRRFPP